MGGARDILSAGMANPNPSPETRFPAGKSGNPGGRTSYKWLREYLDAAMDDGPGAPTRRVAIANHLLEVATSWKVKVRGRGEESFEVASAQDSIEATKILFGYDMGKPTESVEVNNPDGSLGSGLAAALGMNTEQRAAVLAELDRKIAATREPKPDGDAGT